MFINEYVAGVNGNALVKMDSEQRRIARYEIKEGDFVVFKYTSKDGSRIIWFSGTLVSDLFFHADGHSIYGTFKNVVRVVSAITEEDASTKVDYFGLLENAYVNAQDGYSLIVAMHSRN